MKNNRFREALAAGRVPVGHMIMEFGTRGIAKMLEASGVDFVVVDMEHSAFDTERIGDLMACFKATPIAPFVRVPQGLYHFLARSLDAGALGVMVANVETPEQAQSIVSAVKYPPFGKRGVGLGTAHNDYLPPDPATYYSEANASTVVICQIESPIGVANAEAIAATEGVDVLWVGHMDLSTGMGIPAQFAHKDFIQALRTVVAAAKKYGKHAGIQPGTKMQAEEWLSYGYNVISWSADIFLYRAALTNEVKALRAMIEDTQKSASASAGTKD